jgi:hypothetical protein
LHRRGGWPLALLTVRALPLADATGAAEAVEQAGRPGQGQFAQIQVEHFTVQQVEEGLGLSAGTDRGNRTTSKEKSLA